MTKKNLSKEQVELLEKFEAKLSKMIRIGFEVSDLWGDMDESANSIVQSEYPLNDDFGEHLEMLIKWRDDVEDKLK